MYVKFDHLNILKAHQFFFYNQEQLIIIVLEYCPDGNLSKLIGKVDEFESLKIIEQIIEGIAYLHDKKIVHRDIKPENIMMTNGIPKIGDFGVSKVVH